MSNSRPLLAKILEHSGGLGTPSMGSVRQRAEELALIAGHTEVRDEDLQQAHQELHGGHSTLSNDSSDDEMAQSVSERDMVAVSIGHHVQNIRPEDDVNVVEELVAEGMDEAIHEQMLEARKLEPEDDGE